MHAQLTDLGYESFQKRRSLGQLAPAQFDNTRCTAKVVTGYNPRLLVADPDFGQPEGGDGANVHAVYAASSLDVRKG